MLGLFGKLRNDDANIGFLVLEINSTNFMSSQNAIEVYRGERRMAYKKIKMQTIFLTTLLAMSVMFFSRTLPTNASPETIVFVDPPLIKDLMPPTQFTIKVKIANVANFYGIDLQFTWDPKIIKYVSHVKKIPVETYPDGILHQPTIPVRNQVDENATMPGSEPGTRYWLAESSMLPAASFYGNGTIFEMTFRVVGLGNSELKVLSCTLADKDGFPIPYTLQNGYFINYVPPPPPPADIFVSPSSIVNSSLEPCQYFTVSINVKGVQNLYSFDFWLGYNATILEVSQVTVNPLFPPPVITQGSGQVEVSASLVPPNPPINGDLYLATIKFHILAKGESILDLHDVTLLDDQGQPISYNAPGDGYFNNMILTKMFVNPPELIDPTKKPGDIFTIDIDIEDAIGMYGYKFKLGYDHTVLICLGAVVIPPNNDTNFNVEQIINDTIGIIWVKVQYYPPANPITIRAARAVVVITFMVKSYGQTVLNLHDADVVNESGGSLNPVVEDGFFASLLRDVAIVFVNVTSSNKVYPGRIVTIQVVPMNKGNMTTETFNVTVHYGNNTVETKQVTLGPWSNTTLTFYWNTTGLTPCNNFTIWAEASKVPYELNQNNNVFYDGWVKIKIIGDVNGDCVIDILDIVAINLSYGAKEGDLNWNPEADIAPQWGFIDILDLVTCSSKYGLHC